MHRLKPGVDPGLWTGLDFTLCMFCIEKCEGTGGGGGSGGRELGGCGRVRVRALGVQEQTPIVFLSSHAFLPYLL